MSRQTATSLASFCALWFSSASLASAQGVTTAAVYGVVRNDQGVPLSAADVEVRNQATGFITRAHTRDDGRFVASGLESGGPYVITARRIGYGRAIRDSITLTLGQAFRVDIDLVPQAITLAGITSEASARPQSSHAARGMGTLISDSLIHRLPLPDRDIYGLVRLVPQMSTWYGVSGAGASPRVNAIMIDGSSDQGLYGNVPAGGIWGGKSISVEAIKEYQVLLSSFDVRHGNFAGALVNAVTRSGSNELHGSAFYYGRFAALSRNVPFIRDANYERDQAGVSIGGPLIRDRAHFFFATEFQRHVFPTVGAYVGQRADATPALQVEPDTLARFQSILSGLGLVGGSAGPVTGGDPLANFFARLDVALPGINSRLVLRENYSRSDSMAFSRPSPPPTGNCRSIVCFPLSSVARRQLVWKDGTVAQLLTSFANGGYNELIAGRLTNVGSISPVLKQPLIIVQIVPTTQGQTLQSGSYEVAQGDKTDNRSVEFTDNLTIPRGWHLLTLGASAQLFRIRRMDLRGAFGVWNFPSLDALSQGQPQTYRVSRDLGGADVSVPGAQYAIYGGDRWQVSPRFTLTYGLRADVPVLSAAPPYSKRVDTLFDRRTDVVPTGHVHWSPRVGFESEVNDETRITGGAGAFMGRPAMSWIVNAYSNFGAQRSLSCGGPTGWGPPPVFSADPDNPPLACRNGVGFSTDSAGSVNLLDPHLAFPQNLRGSLSIERRLTSSVTAFVDAQYTRALHELFFVNRNLAEPTSTDAHGRVMYGSILPSGRSVPIARQPTFSADVIELTNQSKDYSYSVTGMLEKRFASHLTTNVSLTYGHVYDVQSQRLSRNPAFDNWRLGRTIAGRQDAITLGTSDFDQPYRVVASGTYGFTRRAWTTDVSLYYLGSSGFPFTYLAGGDQQTGDLNADGTPMNDPIYIPRDANDPAEIQFDPSIPVASQQAAFESLIDGAECLRHQRGHIMARNSCRSPWINSLHVAIRQSRTLESGHTVALELQVFNALNLLNSQWGRVAIPSGLATVTSQVNLLTHIGQTTTTPSQSIFRFDPATRRFDAGNVDSYYTIQLGARYSF